MLDWCIFFEIITFDTQRAESSRPFLNKSGKRKLPYRCDSACSLIPIILEDFWYSRWVFVCLFVCLFGSFICFFFLNVYSFYCWRIKLIYFPAIVQPFHRSAFALGCLKRQLGSIDYVQYLSLYSYQSCFLKFMLSFVEVFFSRA